MLVLVVLAWTIIINGLYKEVFPKVDENIYQVAKTASQEDILSNTYATSKADETILVEISSNSISEATTKNMDFIDSETNDALKKTGTPWRTLFVHTAVYLFTFVTFVYDLVCIVGCGPTILSSVGVNTPLGPGAAPSTCVVTGILWVFLNVASFTFVSHRDNGGWE
mgnify:FL=1